MNTTPKKAHGRENDSVEVVDDLQKSEVALREEAMHAFWVEHDIFNKSVMTPAGSEPKGDFVFYDGPPFATGLPHYGHILAGTIKDAIPRFWTMNGYRVRRTWGWDCHGLPLENLIEKKLGLATKRDIEEYGVKNFNEAARDAVLEYADDWKQIIPRMGRWVDMEDDYKTMDSSYTESVWWVFSELNKKELVYEGFKSMHLCPRCGTTLSNFEVNLGYKDIKDIAVTVKLPLVDEPDTSLLVWTTTPWTLPGNLAAAVHQDYEYVKVTVTEETGESNVILAKERLAQLEGMEYEVLATMKGRDLVGKRYEPPFPFLKEQEIEGSDKAWQILHADYVELGEEGTGAVHLAPAYGEDDLVLAQSHDIPIVHHVDESGHFKEWVTGFDCQLVKPKDDEESGVTHLDADIDVVKALKAAGKLLKKENITHSYPHCWRCDTPLLNYATTSWFVRVSEMRDQLVEENNKVHWVPEHVGKNRFGKWLAGARDWAVSRQRYWGAPLPIWKNPESGEYKVFGSLKELQAFVPKSGNTYYTMRHGESTKNVEPKIVTDDPNADFPLTEKGIADTKASAAAIKDTVDLIITSPVVRTKQTAELVAAELGLSADQVIVDERISEIKHGVFEGKLLSEFHESYPNDFSRFTSAPEGGESWLDTKRRMGEFLYSLETEYKDKTILIVSHGDPLALLNAVVSGETNDVVVSKWCDTYPEKGIARKIDFTPAPHNDNYELDFHRPYIDDFALEENGVELVRVPDVFDCWFESGSMPYGQRHFMGEALSSFDPDKGEGFPADFIAESIDQTRGWFYSLMVLGVALFGKSPFENVITNGLVMAEDGKKLSKKLQNYSAPVDLANQVGADSMRFYLLSSPIIKGEDLSFSDKEVAELQRKNIGRLHNVLAMYELFADGTEARGDSTAVLDVWILHRLQQLINDSTVGYKNYELDKATRPITDFVDDLSVWYLRRSRDRLKGDDAVDKTTALATLRYVLQNLALVMAPVMPFYAEYLWQQIKEEDGAESVHLARWPSEGKVNEELLAEMVTARDIVSQALEARTKANIKVRQPIASVSGMSVRTELQPVILDELNAKSYLEADQVSIDTNLTPELVAEGAVRELMRAVQGMRKAADLQPQDTIVLNIMTNDLGKAAITQHENEFKKTIGAESLAFTDHVTGERIETGDYWFTVELIT